MNTFFVGCFCCQAGQGCQCWQGCSSCWKGQWVAKCFEYSFGHCLACMHNTRAIHVHAYVCVCVCVCVLTARVCHAVSRQKAFGNRICTKYSLLCLSLKARGFGFYSNRNSNKNNNIYQFNICSTQQFCPLIAIVGNACLSHSISRAAVGFLPVREQVCAGMLLLVRRSQFRFALSLCLPCVIYAMTHFAYMWVLSFCI